MLIGYAKVPKADGTQVLDLQKGALHTDGVPSDRIYEDLSSGRFDDRPSLNGCLKALQPDLKKKSVVQDVAKRLSITTPILYGNF